MIENVKELLRAHEGLEQALEEELTVKMTKDSLVEMNLTVGSKVYLTFKSTAVEVF